MTEGFVRFFVETIDELLLEPRLREILPTLPPTQQASADYAVVSRSDVRRRPLTKPPQQRCQAPEITGPRVGMAFASIEAA